MAHSFYFTKMRHDPETGRERRALMICIKVGRGGSQNQFVRWLDALEGTMKYALAVAALLAAVAPAYAGGNPFIAGFGQGFMQTQQPYAPQPPAYQPYYYSPPPVYVPQTQFHNYEFPNGRSLNCVTTGDMTTCY